MKVIDAYNQQEGSQRQLAKRFRVSLTFIENLLKRYRTDGTVEPRAHGGGQVAKLSPEQEAVVADLVAENNDAIKARVMRPTGATCWSTDQSSYVCVACALRVGTIRPKAPTYQEKKLCAQRSETANEYNSCG